MNFNEVTWWRNIVRETTKNENQEKHESTNSQSHASAQMGNCGDVLFWIDISQEKTTSERGIK